MQHKTSNQRLCSNRSLIVMLIVFVIAVNLQIIFFNLVYPEQSLLYLANQQIHHLSDLVNIYLHPQLFHYAVPFFRPSGHFLLYQLLAPLTGWHQQSVFFIVNFIFMALAGFYMIRVYQELFSGYWIGGLIAFSIYLMHPSLTLVRFTIMHFEFAYIFFSLLGLYYFILFCKANTFEQTQEKSHSTRLLAFSLLYYLIAISFKESSVMMAAVYGLYFVIFFYQSDKPLRFYNKKLIIELVLLLACLALASGLYLISAWSSGSHPTKTLLNSIEIKSSAKSFIRYVFNIQLPITTEEMKRDILLWRTSLFTPMATLIMWLGSLLAMGTMIAVFKGHETEYQKSLLFLFISSLLFLIIPFGWGEGNPWHFSLTLVMLSLMMGFSIEYLFNHCIFTTKKINQYGFVIALLIGLSTLWTNQLNIKQYQSYWKAALVINTLRNAVFNPPNIKSQLRQNSLIVIEDSIINNAYLLGAGFYPFYYAERADFIKHNILHKNDIIIPDPNFNGSLFRWAYDMPLLSEEIVPFQIELMAAVPNEMVYQWLTHYPNVFCLGYDNKGVWHDKTREFRAMLLQEKARRHLVMRQYRSPFTDANPSQVVMTTKQILPFPDENVCRYLCDQQTRCDGYRYTKVPPQMECDFYRILR